jgi:hypothetical protein
MYTASRYYQFAQFQSLPWVGAQLVVPALAYYVLTELARTQISIIKPRCACSLYDCYDVCVQEIAPTFKRIELSPECVSLKFDAATGKCTSLTTGFCIDRYTYLNTYSSIAVCIA